MAYTTDTLSNVGGNQVSAVASSLPSAQAALTAKQTTEGTDYLTRLRQAIGGQEALPHMYTRIGNELNLPNLATNFNQVSNQMTNLPATYSAATRGFDVNANQLGRIVSTKQAALAPALTTATQNYNTAQTERDKMVAANQVDQARQLKPYDTEQSFLTDRWAREQTGFTSANGQELDALVSKMNAGVTLSEGEQNRANQLAVAEKEYQKAIKVAEINAASDKYKTDALNTWS